MALEFFRRPPILIGVVHLRPLPGAPRHARGLEPVLARAASDARALVSGGCDALLVENFGDAPFHPRDVPPESVASLAIAVRELVQRHPRVPIGVNVLRNDARAALGICAATGASFVRVNVHCGAAVTDQGLLEGRAHETLRERARLAPHVAIFADAHVKHATPLGRELLGDAVRDLVERGLVDAVIVTGPATGEAPAAERVAQAARAAGSAPILIGSGLTRANAPALLAHAQGAIVGSALERGGRAGQPVERARVRALASVFAGLRRSGSRPARKRSRA